MCLNINYCNNNFLFILMSFCTCVFPSISSHLKIVVYATKYTLHLCSWFFWWNPILTPWLEYFDVLLTMSWGIFRVYNVPQMVPNPYQEVHIYLLCGTLYILKMPHVMVGEIWGYSRHSGGAGIGWVHVPVLLKRKEGWEECVLEKPWFSPEEPRTQDYDKNATMTMELLRIIYQLWHCVTSYITFTFT